jgi:hypothetical protein
MKLRHLVGALTTTLFVLTTGAHAHAQGAGSGQVPAVAMGAEAFHKEVLEAKKLLVDSLSSTLARRALAGVVDAMLARRIMASPLGYEQSPDFIRDLNRTHASFVDSLERLNPAQVESVDFSEFETFALSAYQANFEQYSSFCMAGRGFTDCAPGLGQLGLLEFSLVVYAHERDLWREANKRTHFWPWCRRMQ